MARTSYAIAIGSNRRHGRHGAPAGVVRAALREIGGVRIVSPTLATPALGPAGRAFANAAAIVESDLDPERMLARLKRIERAFGRRRGRRWGPRVLDLDIILWSEGPWGGPGPVIPHPSFRTRRFVLDPLTRIAPDWRDPLTGLTVRQLHARLTRPRPVRR
ncbi:2-amino-4-hydroxy-6-hydroxymethyldihydropteridine diphosphokinase [Sphingosinicella ginsenosidimutans]|uniref:2-amino-4-hydroxy-6-hydroxymethyldihydropteridine pyrophosphokinase n=1 Tax=Allosphingosinicella ginsenosidimutans TaxID=1176539 RepID=A0A5C6TV29_9SPHN|nr:2-amino-4-hydroxy-6-hydroxymethyldihydropteridine diphosphokinase [Sphingosinicella ginsenosidimutans]TXC64313.1 2-amino-4-hydroxy-6-hydroxymethyldihydropteridine diphosphokinase [Sphingosinicella ginsenosidimutans]